MRVAGVLACVAFGFAAPAGVAAQAPLPVISITALQDVPRTPKVAGTMTIAGTSAGYRGAIGIDVRGQTSRMFPKLSYGIELRRARDPSAERKVGLLGMTPDDDWILLPAYNDKTLIRDVLALGTARKLTPWAPQTRYVEMVLNGRYWGAYVLVEKPEINRRRIAAGKRGQLYEMTSDDRAEPGTFFRAPVTKRPIAWKDKQRKELAKGRAAALARAVGRLERALYAPWSAEPRRGWRAHLDERTAVDFALVQELFKNQDAFELSMYVHRPAGGRLVLGPVWDFDLSSGNVNFGKAQFVQGWVAGQRLWAERLYADPGFAARFAARWSQLRANGLLERLLTDVDGHVAELGDARQRNFERWPIIGAWVWPNPYDPATGRVRTSYAAEVTFLKDWLRARVAWIDANAAVLRAGP